jgi:hypothetical protein
VLGRLGAGLGLVLVAALLAHAAGGEIVNVTVSPSAPRPGTALVINFELRNPEGRALPTGVVDVRVKGRSIGTIATPAVPAGGSVRLSGGVTLPALADPEVRLYLLAPGGRTATVVPLPLTR